VTTKRPPTDTGIKRRAAGVGKRGPLKGFRQASLAKEKSDAIRAKAVAKAVKAASQARIDESINIIGNLAMLVRDAREMLAAAAANEAIAKMTSHERENPDKLTGEMLRQHAHRRGLSKSAMVGQSDERIRLELRYITQRQYSETAE
jgi:F420-0:gamma-glutamyl ligase-like protein